MLILLPTSTEKEHASNQMVGLVLLGIGGLALIGAMFMEIRDWPITRLDPSSRRRARNAIRAGRALPIPALPPRDVMATQHALRHVQAFAHELMAVPWGERVTVSSVELRPLFDQTVASVRRVPGDWRNFAEPIGVFACMPAPRCYLGAPESLQPLSHPRVGATAPLRLRPSWRRVA